MKHFLFLLFFTLSLSGFSQSAKKDTDTVSIGLTDYEFLTLEKGYAKMLASDIHTQYDKNQQLIIDKENGLVTPDPFKDNKWMIDKEYTKKWLAANIHKTKYKSADEAYDLMWKSVELLKKQVDENKEVYDLLSRASKEQRLKIVHQLTEYLLNHQPHE